MTASCTRRFVCHLALLSFYLGLFPWPSGFAIRHAEAKVSPLHSITRQVKKGNMLVVLDTSGSMTGVPGEPFDAATELGVDCDLGDDCREVTETGQCLVATQPFSGLPRLCSNDAQCRVGQCKYGNDPCLQDFDCPTVGSVCLKDGKPCQYNSDCSPQSSTCKISGNACSSVMPCPPAGRCTDGNAACNNPGGSCSVRYCSQNPALACTADSDCQAVAPPTEETTPGLVAHWKMDEGTGTTVGDSAGTAENFAISGSPGPTWTTGKLGGALAFNGSGDITEEVFPDLSGLNAGLTVAGWVYRPSGLANADAFFAHLKTTTGTVFGLWHGQTSNWLCGEVFGAFPCAGAVLLPDVWQHVAMTWDGANIRMYVNGVQKGDTVAKAGPVPAYTATRGTLGSEAFGAKPMTGKLDDFRVYSRALSAAELVAIMGTPPGLVAHLNFDDNVTDQSGNGFHGTLEGGTTFVAGKSGKGLQLDGTTGCVSIVSSTQGSTLDFTGPFTMTAWAYRTGTGVNQNLVMRRHTTSWQPSYVMGFNGIDSSIYAGPGSHVETSTVPPINQWAHYAASWDGMNMRLYINGVKRADNPAAQGAPVTSAEPTLIGCGTHGGTHRIAFFQGIIDDVKLFNQTLTDAEIAADAELKPAPPPAGSGDLLGHWKFNEGTGLTISDASGYGNNAQLYCLNATTTDLYQDPANCTANGLPGWVAGHTGDAADRAIGVKNQALAEVNVPALDTALSNQITVAAWAMMTVATSSDRTIVHRRRELEHRDDFDLGVNQFGRPRFETPGLTGTTYTIASPDTMPLNTWTHIVGTYDGTTVRLYVNGVLKASELKAYTWPSSPAGYPVSFGAERNASYERYWQGSISEVAIWGRALEATEITNLHAGTMPAPRAFCKPNHCVAQDNSCNASLNTCQGGEVNQCLGVNSSDSCVINQSNKGPAKMCRFEQTFCAVDAHCGVYPGDECVPATSRSVVAKRVLRSVLLNNADIMNFGLMGFSQGTADGTSWDRNGDSLVDAADKDSWPDDYYFPYYKVQNSTGYAMQDRYITINELMTYGCYSESAGPSGSCTIGSISYQLRANVNARYSVYKNGSFIELDQPYCGHECVITTESQGWLLYGDPIDGENDEQNKKYHDARGTGQFRGGHYTFSVANGTYDVWDQPLFLKQFQGRHTTINGLPYTYFKPRNDYYWNPMAGTNRPPIKGAQCGNQCSITCGGNWDPNLIPIMDTSDNPTQAKANLQKMLPLLEKAEDGGLMHWERGPVGCALINDFLDGPTPAPDDKKRHSAWHYMQDIKAGDALLCRDNFILLITDGETNGPGDVDASGVTTCDNLDCRVQWDDPNATVGPSCQCKSVLNALKLRKSVAQGGLNVKTYVIGFSPDAVIGPPATINESIARAGGTCRAPGDPSTTTDDKCMFLAANETELHEAIQAVIFDAIKGSYSTTPASAVSGVQTEDKITPGGILFDARVDFPTWRGHLIAYDTGDIDTATGQPKLMWDAGGPQFFPDPNDTLAYRNWTKWKDRRIYTSAGADMVPFQIDPTTGGILNRAELMALGLGNTEDEAERVAQWMLGDPKQRNKAVLGAFVNSTPIEVGPPGLTSLPGGKAFHELHKNRVSLVYAAGDDGLLHAFFTRDATIGGVTYRGGEEAFAYIPPEMLRVLTRLYTQGGQKADPRQHIYGLTSSPKVKNVCWTNCDDDASAQWKSIMIMTNGWGGTEAFMLDVTAPFGGGDAFASPPVKVLWHTNTVSPGDKTQYDAILGSTVSVPAFYFGKSTTRNDHRVVFASGYKSNPATSSDQGITLANTSALDGRLLDSDSIVPTGCSTVELTALTDVAAARNFDFREQQQMLGAFFGDTWGNLWRYIPGVQGVNNDTSTSGNLSLLKAFGCQHPLHFSPAVVQPDRDDPLNHPGEAYIVQVSNSALDPETEKFEPSRMIIRKEKRTSISGGLAADETWIPGGQMEFVAGTDSLCGVYDPNGGGDGTCSQALPAHARPTSTPLAILKGNGTGFVIMSLWYAPPQEICEKGRSYLALHEININSYQAVQRAGIALIDEPVTSAVIVNKKVVYTDSQGKVHDVTSQLNQTFVAGGAISDITKNGGVRFQQTGWTELP